jgi:hypothetical protein
MKRAIPLSCLFLSCFAVATARADPFMVVNGEAIFTVDLATQGVFGCRPTVPCTGTGSNSVTLGSGANMATVTFHGVHTTFQVGNTSQPVTLGTFEVTSTPGFTFPARTNPNNTVLDFSVLVSHTLPVADSNTTGWGFGPGGRTTLPLLTGEQFFTMALGPNPPGFNYKDIVYSKRPFPFSIPGSGSQDLTYDVGVVPEPTSLVLLGSGLVGTVLARRRKRASRG